jgi:hypothetical protein
MLTADPLARLPDSRSIGVDTHHRVVAAAIPLPVTSPPRIPVLSPSPIPVISPSWIPVADANPTPRPIAIVIEPGPDGKTDSEGQCRPEIGLVGLHIDNFRIILWYVDHLGFGGHDPNTRFFLHNFLLRSINKVTCSDRLRPQLLDGIHHVSGLVEKSVTDLCGPLKVLVHPLKNVRIVGERLDAIVPWLVRDLRWISL